MKRESLVLVAVLAALAVVAAFLGGIAVANHDDPGRIGPAMMVGSSGDAPYGWGDGRGPMTDRWSGSMMDDFCPAWSAGRGAGPGAGWRGWMMGPRSDTDR